MLTDSDYKRKLDGFYKNKQYEQALNGAIEWIGTEPENVNANLYAGLACSVLNKHDEAHKYLGKVFKILKDILSQPISDGHEQENFGSLDLGALGTRFHANGNYSDAIACYDLHFQHAPYLFLRSNVKAERVNNFYLYTMQKDGKTRLFYATKMSNGTIVQEQEITEQDINVDSLMRIIKAIDGKNLQSISKEDKSEILKIASNKGHTIPYDLDLVRYKGQAFMALGEFYKALHCFDQVLWLDSKNVKALSSKGLVYQNQDEYDIALYYYEKILVIEPRNKQANINKGIIKFCQRNFQEALKIFQSIIKSEEDFYVFLAYSIIEISNINMSEHAKWIEKINQSGFNKLKIWDQASFYCMYGKMLLAISVLPAAKLKFDEASKLQPNDKHIQKCIKNVNQLLLRRDQKPWEININLKDHAKKLLQSHDYVILPATSADISQVAAQYLSKNPIPGYDIKCVEVIYNPNQEKIFSSRIRLLNNRGENEKFWPTWNQEPTASWKNEIDNLCMKRVQIDPKNKFVKMMSTWHGFGTDADGSKLKSIATTGFANLATTDSGYFGKGIYGTEDTEYAWRVYGKNSGNLLMNWVCFHSAYPITAPDQSKIAGGPNYANYDAHFVLVNPKNPGNPNEVVYNAINVGDPHFTYTELVIFDPAQVLPRYVVTFQPTMPKQPILARNAHGFFATANPSRTQVNLLDAIQYVYDEYLSKPYTGSNPFDTKFGIIHRPNHGLVDSCCKLSYVPWVIEYYLEFKSEKISSREAKRIRSLVNEMQLYVLFSVSCREDEASFKNDENNYLRYQKNSKQAFIEFVKALQYPIPEERISEYTKGDLAPFQTENHIGEIFKICHWLNLLRCYNLDRRDLFLMSNIEVVRDNNLYLYILQKDGKTNLFYATKMLNGTIVKEQEITEQDINVDSLMRIIKAIDGKNLQSISKKDKSEILKITSSRHHTHLEIDEYELAYQYIKDRVGNFNVDRLLKLAWHCLNSTGCRIMAWGDDYPAGNFNATLFVPASQSPSFCMGLINKAISEWQYKEEHLSASPYQKKWLS